MTETRLISDIKVGPRFRKDLGDIAAFAETIQKTEGLLQPIGITKDNELACGQRRLEAYKLLGYTEIPVYIVPTKDILLAEFYENSERKDWTIEERVDLLEEIERQRIGHRQKKGSNLEPFQEELKNKKSVDIVAKITHTSAAQIYKEKKIVDAAREKPKRFGKILDSINKNEMTVHSAFTLLRDYDKPTALPYLPTNQSYYILLVDPPWSYDAEEQLEGGLSTPSANPQYKPMDYVEISELNIPAYKDSMLFLWVPMPKAEEAYYVVQRWGFQPKTCSIWTYETPTGGAYFKEGLTHKLLYICEKGNMPLPEESNRYSSHLNDNYNLQKLTKDTGQTFTSPYDPQIVHAIIEQMYPNRKYIELFSRENHGRANWTYWGLDSSVYGIPKREIEPIKEA